MLLPGDRFAADCAHVDEIMSSPNVNRRRRGLTPKILVMHYTGLPTFARSLEVLRDPHCEVSCHYVVDTDGRIVQMVPEALRAWHAGVSSWDGERDINSKSIGIEIQNPGHTAGYPDFPDAQMQAVTALAADIVARHGMTARCVVAHSDVAPGRKIDPVEKFDWHRLFRAGIGCWVPPTPLVAGDDGYRIGQAGPAIRTLQGGLNAYGYQIDANGVLDPWTETVVSAFQRHFRPRTCRRLYRCFDRRHAGPAASGGFGNRRDVTMIRSTAPTKDGDLRKHLADQRHFGSESTDCHHQAPLNCRVPHASISTRWHECP